MWWLSDINWKVSWKGIYGGGANAGGKYSMVDGGGIYGGGTYKGGIYDGGASDGGSYWWKGRQIHVTS
jgi:hypothetical protein